MGLDVLAILFRLLIIEADKIEQVPFLSVQAPNVNARARQQKLNTEVNGVELEGLPLEYMVALAHVVGCCIHREYYPIVLMLELVLDEAENDVGVPYIEHLFHKHINWWNIVLIRDELPEHPCLRESFLHVFVSLY